MPDIQLNFTGGTYEDRAKTLSNQSCVNFYPKLIDNNKSQSQYVLQNWVGLKPYTSITPPTSGYGRGLFEHKNILYHVVGEYLYKLDSYTETHQYIGKVIGNKPCIIRGFGNGVVIASDGLAYYYDSSSGLSKITDVDLESPITLDVLNNQVIYQGIDGRFGVSEAGNAMDIPALNYATAESNADDLVRVFAFGQRLWLFGEKTTEQWWNSGVGSPPFDRVDGAILQRGTNAPFSVAKNDNDVFFLSDDNQIFSLSGAKLSDKSLNQILDKYIKSDAYGWCMTLEGQEFYVLTFPLQNKTWVLPIGGQWFEWSSQVTNGRALANNYAYFNNKHIVSSCLDGALYELDFDTYTENGTAIIRTRDTGVIHGGLINAGGKRIFANRLELLMETGVGLISGQGSDPEIMMSFSDNGGRTWSTERRGKIGKIGEYLTRVEWHALGSFVNRIFRFSVSDPVFISIHSAVLNVEVGI